MSHSLSLNLASSTSVALEIQSVSTNSLKEISLIYSLDQGFSWYSLPMQRTTSYFSVVLLNLRVKMEVFFMFQIITLTDNLIVDNNSGQYYRIVVSPVNQFQPIGLSRGLYSASVNQKELISPTNLPPEFNVNQNPFLASINNRSIPTLENSSPTLVLNGLSPLINQPDIDTNKTQALSISSAIPMKKITGNESQARDLNPIVPYNPFEANINYIDYSSNPIFTFSPSFTNKNSNHNSKVDLKTCNNCQTLLNSRFKICPSCGNKAG